MTTYNTKKKTKKNLKHSRIRKATRKHIGGAYSKTKKFIFTQFNPPIKIDNFSKVFPSEIVYQILLEINDIGYYKSD